MNKNTVIIFGIAAVGLYFLLKKTDIGKSPVWVVMKRNGYLGYANMNSSLYPKLVSVGWMRATAGYDYSEGGVSNNAILTEANLV